MKRTIVICTACERVYAARKRDEGFLLSTRDGNCGCGNGTVEELERRPVAD